MNIENLIIFIALILPIIIFFSIIFFYDNKKEEPLKKIILSMIFGATTLILAILLIKVFQIFNDYPNMDFIKVNLNIISVVILGIIVEIIRFIFFYILSVKNKDCDELYDYIIYSLSMMFVFVICALVIYMFYIKQSSILFISIFALAPTQIFTSIIMGNYMSISMFTKKKEQKSKTMIKALFIPVTINCAMYSLLINQNYFYAYSSTIYYSIIAITFIIEIVVAIFAIKLLKEIYELDKKYKNGEKIPIKYKYLINKKEFKLLEKRSKDLLSKEFKQGVCVTATVILSILTLLFINTSRLGEKYIKSEKQEAEIVIGNDYIPKIQIINDEVNQKSNKIYILDGSIISVFEYSSVNPQIELDKYMNYLLKNGYVFTSSINEFNKTKIYQLTKTSEDKDKLILIDIKSGGNEYYVKIEKRTGLVKK